MTKELEQDDSVQDSAVEAETPEQTDEDIWNEINSAPKDDGSDDADDDDPIEQAEPKRDADPEPEGSDDEGKEASSEDPDKLREQIERLTQQRDSEKGRARGLNMKYERIQSELRAAKAELDALKSAETDDATRKQLSKAREEYGDVLGPVLSRMEKSDEANRRMAQVQSERVKSIEAERRALAQEELGTFVTEHPDGIEFLQKNGDDFRAWVEDQPAADREIYNRNRQTIVDGAASALLLSKFRQHIAAQSGHRPANQSASRRQRQLAGAQSVRAASTKVVTSDNVPSGDDPEALWKYWTSKGR